MAPSVERGTRENMKINEIWEERVAKGTRMRGKKEKERNFVNDKEWKQERKNVLRVPYSDI